MDDLIPPLAALWQQQPVQAIGSTAIAFIALLAIYLFFHERSLRRQLADIQPDRRLLFLLHRWQLRNYGIIFATVAIAAVFMSIWPAPTSCPKATEAASETIHAALDCNAPPPGVDPATIEPQDPKAVIDLFEAPAAITQQQGLDALKSRYENMLTGTYVLHHCKRADKGEMDAILTALREELMRYQASAPDQPIDTTALYAGIVSAAEGSYEMVYRNSPCDSPEMDMLEQQFAHFVMQSKSKTSPKENKKAKKEAATETPAPAPPSDEKPANAIPAAPNF